MFLSSLHLEIPDLILKQTKSVSILHEDEHPSPSKVFLSSHWLFKINPSPQMSSQTELTFLNPFSQTHLLLASIT
jgi:hypothetical protein